VLSGRKKTEFIAFPPISSKTGKQGLNKGSTELYCLFVAANSIVDAISFGFEYVNTARTGRI